MSHESYLRSALSKYRYPDQTKQEVLAIFQNFSDLRPLVDNYVFNDGTVKELLCLDGTIPVTYKGRAYNIPIRIYLLDTHPFNPPLIYVRPTPTMQIKQGRHVDMAGRVYLPYLHEWEHPTSDLMGVIQIMAIIFGEEPPVFSKPQNSAATVAQTPYSGGPASGQQPPPYPTAGCSPNSAATVGQIIYSREQVSVQLASYPTAETVRTTSSKCSTCGEGDVDAVVNPCGHMFMCYACASKLLQQSTLCPICKTTMQTIIQVHRI